MVSVLVKHPTSVPDCHRKLALPINEKNTNLFVAIAGLIHD
jgi:hypothetical protein